MLFENHKHDHEKEDEDPKAKEQNVLELSTITFGAFNFSTDRRKGWEELLRALFIYANTNNKTKSKINIFGEVSAATKSLEQHYEVNYLGHINDEKKLANGYTHYKNIDE